MDCVFRLHTWPALSRPGSFRPVRLTRGFPTRFLCFSRPPQNDCLPASSPSSPSPSTLLHLSALAEPHLLLIASLTLFSSLCCDCWSFVFPFAHYSFFCSAAQLWPVQHIEDIYHRSTRPYSHTRN
jgi:hypothetical protein